VKKIKAQQGKCEKKYSRSAKKIKAEQEQSRPCCALTFIFAYPAVALFFSSGPVREPP